MDAGFVHPESDSEESASDSEVNEDVEVVELHDEDLIYPESEDEAEGEEEVSTDEPQLANIQHGKEKPRLQSTFVPQEKLFPQTFRIPVALDGVEGHCATVDNGSSATFMHPSTAMVRGLKVLK
ncbi:hypothetical protein JCM11641_002664 [Rhodosporidiobolus odoratus]